MQPHPTVIITRGPTGSLRVVVQYNTIQYNAIQYNTIQYNTLQYNTIQYKTIQCNTIQYNTLQSADRCESTLATLGTAAWGCLAPNGRAQKMLRCCGFFAECRRARAQRVRVSNSTCEARVFEDDDWASDVHDLQVSGAQCQSVPAQGDVCSAGAKTNSVFVFDLQVSGAQCHRVPA